MLKTEKVKSIIDKRIFSRMLEFNSSPKAYTKNFGIKGLHTYIDIETS